MPRPKSITWETRVSVFLEYHRTGGKVNPVANRYGIARSTVRVIVNEFIEMGFSQSPRAKVSLDLLKEMQEQHVEELATGLSVGSDVPGVGVGYLNLGPGTDAEEGRQKASEQPMPVPEEALWHLRGTKAERVIEEAISAVRDLLRRESEASASLRMAIEEACQQPERDGALDDAGPYLLPALRRRVRRSFFDKELRRQLLPANTLRWDIEPDRPRALRLQGEVVAIGNSEEHQGIKKGMAGFLADGFLEHERRFVEVDRLRRDLRLMQGIVVRALGSVTEDEKRSGICPACPYPEAVLEAKEKPNSTRRDRRLKGGAQ